MIQSNARNYNGCCFLQVCSHIIQSVHTEMLRMKEEWEATSSKPTPPKPSRQMSMDPSTSEAGIADSYCYELLSMLIGLSQSEVGCAFLSEQEKLIQDLVTLLHVATVRIQMQVCVCVCCNCLVPKVIAGYITDVGDHKVG